MKYLSPFFVISVFLVTLFHYTSAAGQTTNTKTHVSNAATTTTNSSDQQPGQHPRRLIHIVVALCDNQYQGIVPVPARIGNGDDPDNNLYWGAAFGVKTYFKKSKEWTTLFSLRNPKPSVLERIILKHKDKEVYIVADAYRGREIRQATTDFLRFAAGTENEVIDIPHHSKPLSLHAGAGADLVVYVGHDGLMDFSLSEYPQKADKRERAVIILACASKRYFQAAIRQAGATPLLWTTGLMAPEAYVLKSAIDGWIMQASGDEIRQRAAVAYNKYQKCGAKAALNLFSHGW